MSPYPIDIGFMIYSAPSLRRKKNWNKAKQFIASIATTLGIEKPNSRAAVLQYGDIVGRVFTFSNYTDLPKFLNDLYRLPYEPGKNRIDVAIRRASKQIFSSESRPAVSRIAVLLTFGKAAEVEQAKAAAAELRVKRVKLILVHVGSEADMALLRDIVSSDDYLFHSNILDNLTELVLPLHDKIISESGICHIKF